MKRTPTLFKHDLNLKQRITAGMMAAFMLLQICLPAAAAAASAWGSQDDFARQIQHQLQSPLFVPASNTSAAYQNAFYLSDDTLNTPTLERFFQTYNNTSNNSVVKSVGDAFVQTHLIRSQINALLGRMLIASEFSLKSFADMEAAQITALYAAGEKYGHANGLIFGAAATVAGSSDMIWPEVRSITTANGQTESLLVPVVYLSTASVQTGVIGNQILFNGDASFDSITLNAVTLLTGWDSTVSTLNGIGLLNAKIVASGNLTLKTSGTFANLGGTVSAQNDLSIIAGAFLSKTVVVPYRDQNGQGTRLGQVASISSDTGKISIKSFSDITFEGSLLSADKGSITLDATKNINLLPVATSTQSYSQDGGWSVNKSTLNLLQTKFTAQDTISLMAGGVINISAAELYSTRGGIELLAQQGIFILDEMGYTQVDRSKTHGKLTGTGSDFNSYAVRSVLHAGKGILLDTENGDITLRAADIKSTTGTTVKAHNGKVHLLITKEQNQHYLNTVKKSFWTIKTVNEQFVEQKGVPNAIVGGLAVEALEGLDVEYTGIDLEANPNLTLDDQINEYRKMPEMAWMATLYDNQDNKVNWEEVTREYKHINERKTNLSPAAMAIIAICVAVAMGPMGANLVGGGGIGAGTATSTFAGFTTTTTTLSINGAIAQAAMLTIATSAAQSLAAGHSLRETINAMDSDDNLKALAISMATAGAMNYLDAFKAMPFGKVNDVDTLGSIGNQAYQAVVNATVTAGVSVSINGGNSADYKKAFTQSLAANAVNTIGQKLSDKISTSKTLSEASKYITHAAMGCMTSGLTNKISDQDFKDACVSGAGGAVISDLMTAKADKLKNEMEAWATENAANPDSAITYAQFAPKLESFRAQGADLAKLVAALAAFAVGGDVNAAATSADMVSRSNMAKAVDLASIYLEINGTTNCGGLSFTQCQYAHVNEVLDVSFAQAGFSKADADKYKQQMQEKGLLSAAAEIKALYYANGKNIDALVKQKNQRDGGSTIDANGVIEVTVVGADSFAIQLDRFAAGTKQIIDSMTPAQQIAFSVVIGAVVTGPISAIISAAQNAAIETVIPDQIASTIEGISNGVGTGITAFVEHSEDANLLDEYNAIATLAATTAEYRDTVGGYSWIVTSITGLGGKKGTNKSPSAQYMKNPNDGSAPPNGKKFAPKKAPLGDNFTNGHLSKVDRDSNGNYLSSKKGLLGGHNKEELLKAMENPRSLSTDPKIQGPKYTPGDEKAKVAHYDFKDANGRVIGTQYEYQYPEVNTNKIIQYDEVTGNIKYGSTVFKKTTYDPKVINDANYQAAAERASQKVYDDKLPAFLSDPSKNRIVETVDPVSGIKFAVYFNQSATINAGQPFVGNAHIIP